jgi:hypothetical protein
MKEQSADLLAMLSERRNAKDLAEEAATSLRKDEREIDDLRVAALTALRKARPRVGPASQSVKRLEEVLNRIVSPQNLSVASGLRECAQAAAHLEPSIEQAQANRNISEETKVAKHLKPTNAPVAVAISGPMPAFSLRE